MCARTREGAGQHENTTRMQMVGCDSGFARGGLGAASRTSLAEAMLQPEKSRLLELDPSTAIGFIMYFPLAGFLSYSLPVQSSGLAWQ